MHSNEIEVDVNESYIARVENGQQVTATLDAYPDKPIPAKVRTVIPRPIGRRLPSKSASRLLTWKNTISSCRTWA